MILTGLEIADQVACGSIHIDNFDPAKVNPNSYNLTLANEFLVYPDGTCLDFKTEPSGKRFTLENPDEGYLLCPGELLLARTAERTITNGFVPMLEGRSSIGRYGVFIHVTAGFGDDGFNGFWTLEMTSVVPVRIYPGVEICQIYYHTMEGKRKPYVSGKYQNNQGIQESGLWKEFKDGKGRN